MKEYKRGNVEVKVQVVHHTEDIGNNRKKQDVIVSDNTAHISHYLGTRYREKSVGKSYKVTGMWVREFREVLDNSRNRLR